MLERYRRATSKSHQLWERALQIHPGGVSHNLRTFGLHRIGLYPPFMKRGEGAHLWDVDDNEYIDWWMTHFSILLGHNHPKVRKAIQERIVEGLHLGTLNQTQVEFAEKLKEAIPYLDKVRFSVTGSEAVMYAVRLARAFTKRRLVAKARGGWHGGNDALLYHIKYPFSDEPVPNGVSFEFNDQQSIDSLLKKYGKNLAAIVIEPVIGAGGALNPEPEFLPYLREETERLGILLIFDEIITGFRLCFGSAGKEVFSVEPDLITLGKIVAGGMPLGVYGGREDIMALAEPGREGGCWVGGGTFSSHPVSMVSGIATLDTLHSLKSEYRTLNQRGNRFRDHLNDTFETENTPLLATGVGSIIFLHWLKGALGDSPITPSKIGEVFDSTRQDFLQAALFEQRIFGYHGLGGISFAHTDMDIQMTQKALFRAIAEVNTLKL
ncbi:MAG: aspartate aminotransferase family protein [Promethearchaeota archaeon]